MALPPPRFFLVWSLPILPFLGAPFWLAMLVVFVAACLVLAHGMTDEQPAGE
jgi:hypothetical protein